MAAHRPQTAIDDESIAPLFSPADLTEEEGIFGGHNGSTMLPPELKSTSFLILLTIGMGGLQIVYAVLYSHGLTHLRSLGLDKSQAAITFLAGPLSGIFVQPVSGIWSDHCRLSWGKRRPFIVFGGIILVLSLLGLAWTKSLVRVLFAAQVSSSESKHIDAHRCATSAMAKIFTFCIFSAIQPIQGGIRALIVDLCPAHQQQDANAWASRIGGMASVLGYLLAFVDLPQYISFFGDTQFKNLSVISSVILVVVLFLSCISMVEKDPRGKLSITSEEDGMAFFRWLGNGLLTLASAIRGKFARIPKPIIYICVVQFFAWIGWYPYLLYVTTYIGEIYFAESSVQSPYLSSERHDEIWERAARVGSLALLVSSMISLLAAILLPYLTPPSFTNSPSENQGQSEFAKFISIPWLTLPCLWMISQGLFAICMFTTLFVSSVVGNIAICAIIGIAWAAANWVPYTLLGLEILQISRTNYSISDQLAPWEDCHDLDMAQPGTVFALHNIAVCLPQIIISVGSSSVWKSQSDAAQDHANSTGWVLRSGGVGMLITLWLTMKIQVPKLK